MGHCLDFRAFPRCIGRLVVFVNVGFCHIFRTVTDYCVLLVLAFSGHAQPFFTAAPLNIAVHGGVLHGC
jgi:hypothetical protein